MAEKPPRRKAAPRAARAEPHDHDESERAYMVRGRRVRTTFHAEHGHEHLEIDGRRIPIETRESGVMSPMMMFEEFSSVHDLAEALVRDWGTWQPPDDAYEAHPHRPAVPGGGGGHSQGGHGGPAGHGPG